MKGKWLIGIDEVGRGPLAGPVTVAAVAVPVNFKIPCLPAGRQMTNYKTKLKDSKKLTVKQREEWVSYVKNHPKIFYAAASVYSKVIDRINISQAANLAATRAIRRLMTNDKRLMTRKFKIVLDGGLYLHKSLVISRKLLVRTVVRGDEKYNCIKLASIVAKVRRDRLMRRCHKKYPKYGFDRHKGYGTKAHLAAINKHGPCNLHRLTFIKNFISV